MDAVIKAAFIYLFLLVVFRLAGRRSLSEMTTFDLLLLLIVSETTQQAMVGDDHSVTRAVVLIVTFVMIDVGLSLLKQRSDTLEKFMEGTPVVLVENGRPIKRTMDKERVGEEDILEVARVTRGVMSLDQIKFAVLERSGKISIITAKRVNTGETS